MQPLFSIITITFNAEQALPATLESVKQQSFSDFEYIVVDGASSDGTVAVARAAAIAGARIFSEPDRGLYDAMNKGIGHAAGKYLIFLNAGDAFAAPDVLARLAALAADEPGIIYGQTQLVDENRKVVGMRHLTAPRSLTAKSFGRGMLVCHQAFAARRDLVEEYDLSYRFSADYDWCIRCLKKSPRNAYAGDTPIISYLTNGITDKNRRSSLVERYRIMCRHYGTLPTILRHISFIPRFLGSRLK